MNENTILVYYIIIDTGKKGRGRYVYPGTIELGEFHLMDTISYKGFNYKITGVSFGNKNKIYMESVN